MSSDDVAVPAAAGPSGPSTQELAAALLSQRDSLHHLAASMAEVQRSIGQLAARQGPQIRGADDDGWGFLPSNTVQATTPGAVGMIERLASAPTVDRVKALQDMVPVYEGVLATPKGKADLNLYLAQKKFECIMHMVVHVYDNQCDARAALANVAAVARSGFEDLSEERRRRVTGGRPGILEPREDIPDSSLLNKEEWDKLRAARGRGAGRGAGRRGGGGGRGGPGGSYPFRGNANNSNYSGHYERGQSFRSRSRSNSRSRPRGRGRGQA